MGVIEYLEKVPISNFHYILLLLGCLIYGFTAMNTMLISAALPAIISEWSLDSVTAGFLLSSGYIGMFIGALSCGFLADAIGRKKALIFTIFLMSIFTGLCSIANEISSMFILRFLAGIGLGGTLPQPGVYISEYVPAKYRGKFVGFVETSWVFGALLAIAFPFLLIPLYGWRLTFLIAFIPLLLIILVIFFTPESLRYLELKNKYEEIFKILKKHKLISEEINKEKIFYKLKDTSKKTSFKEIFSLKYRKRTLLLWILWAVLVYTYHGIFLWLPTIYVKEFGFEIVKSLYWTLIVTLIQVPGYFSATFLLDIIGRKKVLAIYLGLAGISCLLLSIAKDVNAILLWSCFISFFNLGAWAGLYTYTPELYPTRIRGTGSGAAASIGRLAGILAPTLTGFLYSIGKLLFPFIVFTLAHLIASLSVIFLGIETKGKILEEISE
ncbi:MAG: MFS transporter [Nitrososphaerota archaeon]